MQMSQILRIPEVCFVTRSGLCFLAQTSVIRTLSSGMFFTGIQYDPVLSIATLLAALTLDRRR